MLVDTEIAIGLPQGTYGRLAARSAMASRCEAQSSQKDKGVKLPYLSAQTSKKD